MKRLVESDECGFESQLGEKLCFFCGVYIYAGVLSGVNEDHLELMDAVLVYETGDLIEGQWKDAQQLPSPWRIMKQSIETWGVSKC